MSLKEDIVPYIDIYGLVHPWVLNDDQSNKSQNGVCYLGEYYAALFFNNELNLQDIQLYNNTIKNCMIEPGLLRRSPSCSDQEGLDDYVGMLLGAYMTSSYQLAEQVIDYGNRHFWIFNNVNPGTVTWSAFLLRFPALIAHAHWAANKSPNLFCYLWWCISVFVAALKKREDGMDNWRLSWAMIKVNNKKGWLAKFVSKFWYYRLYKMFPFGMQGVSANYYQVDPPHPFIKYWIT